MDLKLNSSTPNRAPKGQMKNFLAHHYIIRKWNGVNVWRRLPSWYSTGPGRRGSHG